jgi:hypothetical protein
MSRSRNPYFTATQHPWSCLVFVLPLLAIYEVGILWIASTEPDTLRNGADTWLRWALDALGLRQLFWVPVLVAALLFVWGWLRRQDRPGEMLPVWMGMAVESAVFALGLWGISAGLKPLRGHLGIQVGSLPQVEPAFERAISYLGAGIYEELLFRVLLFTALVWLLRSAAVGRGLAILVAGTTAALVFAYAHHLGPNGEEFDNYVFFFRTVAGLYFTFVFQLRGFGVTVGAHALYNVLVGIIVPSFWHPA